MSEQGVELVEPLYWPAGRTAIGQLKSELRDREKKNESYDYSFTMYQAHYMQAPVNNQEGGGLALH